MSPDLVKENEVDKIGRQKHDDKNPLKQLFEFIRGVQEKLDKLPEKTEKIDVTVESLNYVLNNCLAIEIYLAKKPMTISEIYIWAKDILKTTPIVTLRDTKEMWKYDKENGKYVPDAETYVQSLCTNEKTGSARASTPDVFKKLILNIQGDSFLNREEFESPAYVINLNNGVYNKANGILYNHDPKLYFTYKLPFDYDPNADCPTFKNVVNNLFPDKDDRITMQRWYGYHFMPGYPYQKYLHLCGPSGAGKSVLLLGLYVILGKGNYTAFSLQDFQDRTSYATPSIYKKLGNICADMKTTSVRDMSMMKKLVSNVDTISTRNIYGKNYEFINSTKMTFVSNKMPIAKKSILSDEAVMRRAMIFKVNKADFDVNENMNELIISETSGIFNWAMEGYSDLMKNKSFDYSKNPYDIWVDNMEESDDDEKDYLSIPRNPKDFIEKFKESDAKYNEQFFPGK